ncbi:DUF1983 domain-containing protein [Pseudomonas sp. SWRI51]|uniref:phage tail tip fiber protein n=1 Tax=Pseudomonas sp. SWRI51 TaxID=2745491 RepID=UPI0016484645|nr:DUF1983 domain-containing protein [Pseudomonas sp. SWRI51]MBC3411274.1 DUF1983 domain-containing protein [Pseudomonas sp. SWRI51]
MSKAVKKIALVAAGAALGFVTGGVGFAILGGAVGLFIGSQQTAALKSDVASSSGPSAQTVRSSKAPVRFILGRVSTGGVLVWAQEQSGSQTDGEWVHLVYVLSEGAVDALEAIYLGEEDIKTYGGYASYELVVDPTKVNAFLKANCRDWRDVQIGRGLSFVRLSLKHSAEKFPSGIPDVRFVVRGRKDMYDPRSGLTGYSGNTALHLLWYLRVRCKVPDDEILFQSFASAANVCDEAVTNADDTAGVRYQTGCVIGADEQRTQVLQKLEESCAGQLIRVGGKWMLQAGAYYGPHDFEITEDMIIGTVSGSTEVNNDAAINVVTGTFVDPSQTWAETDFPEVRIQQWVDEDGGESSDSMTLSYVTNAYQAQRLANIKLRRTRAGGSLQFPMNFMGYNCRPGRVVWVNLPSLNIVGEFIVTDWGMAADDGCTVTVTQYSEDLFDDAVGEPYDPIGIIDLPSGGLGSPTDLVWARDESAEVVQGLLSWVPPFGVVTGYAVTVRQSGTAVQAQQVPDTTLQLPIGGLPSGRYTIAVAALGPLTRSGEASITVNIDGPAAPETCTVQSTVESITLLPRNVQHGLNGGTYEYFYSLDPQATVEQAEYLGQGLSLTHTGLAFFTNYYYFIRSRNAYGVSSFLRVPASTSTNVTTMLEALKDKIERSQLGPELGKEIDDLQDQIAALDGLKAYDPDQVYEQGQLVVVDGRIYQALHEVAADPEGGNTPPNNSLWADVGQTLETANGLAQQVQLITARTEEVDGRVTASADQLSLLQAAWRPDSADGDLADALAGWETKARIKVEERVRASETEALARRAEELNVSIGDTSAAVGIVSEAVVRLDGKVGAQVTIKAETTVGGQTVQAGLLLGSDGETSQILNFAQRWAIVDEVSGVMTTPVVVEGGQMFINTALINKAFIQELVLSMSLKSQAVDPQGRPLIEIDMVNGTFAVRGHDGDGSTLLNNGGVYVYDVNDVERAAIGRLT